MTNADFSSPAWKIESPKKADYGLGIVGCGGIVQYAHLPAYKAAGFNVVAVYDQDREVALSTAAEHGVGTVARSLDELLATEGVEIVDIAVPPWVQPGIVKEVAAAGKHMLCQKPLALDLDTASEIIELAARAGVKQAVNQQVRWSAGFAASRSLVAAGAIGVPTEGQMLVSVSTPWHMWPWLAKAPRLEVNYHSIHYLDAIRSVLGDPVAITSVHGRFIDQEPVQGETRSTTVLEYEGQLQVLVAVNHYNQHGTPLAEFRFLGTDGALEGTFGGMKYEYPDGRPDTLQLLRSDLASPIRYEFDTMWIPDTFAGPMGDLMDAITEDRDPLTDSRDNVKTLRIIEASYRSASEGRKVLLSEFGDDSN